jgi:ABC-type phosphate transport system permease subunit
MSSIYFVALVVLALTAFVLGRNRAAAVAGQAKGTGMHSLPAYHGLVAASSVFVAMGVSFAVGAIRKVVLAAALPGIVSAFMLAISRAIGETMIVVMAAGLAANLTLNPLDAVTTITVQIKTILVGDQEFDSAKTLAAFALGFVLFFVTLALNYIAL